MQKRKKRKKTLRFLLFKKLLELLSVLKKLKRSLAHWTLRKGFRDTHTLLWENKGGYCTEGHVFILPSQAWKPLDCKIVAHKSVEVRNWLNLSRNCHWFLSSNDCSVDWWNCSLFSEGKSLILCLELTKKWYQFTTRRSKREPTEMAHWLGALSALLTTTGLSPSANVVSGESQPSVTLVL